MNPKPQIADLLDMLKDADCYVRFRNDFDRLAQAIWAAEMDDHYTRNPQEIEEHNARRTS